jgi:ribosomal protein S18 acetylase RimI-like enzyme
MNTPPLTIRPAGRDDAEAVAAFGERTFRETFGPYNRAEDMDAYCTATYALERQRREIVDPARVTILAEVGDELAAYAQLREGPAPGCVTGPAPIELLRFYVDRTWHGQGLAATLMAEVIAQAKERGGRTLYLCVWERNLRAIAFYGKQGFRGVGTQLFLLGDDRQVDLVMVRPIGGSSALHNPADVPGEIPRLRCG